MGKRCIRYDSTGAISLSWFRLTHDEELSYKPSHNTAEVRISNSIWLAAAVMISHNLLANGNEEPACNASWARLLKISAQSLDDAEAVLSSCFQALPFNREMLDEWKDALDRLWLHMVFKVRWLASVKDQAAFG
jgi:hypothetical protein